jgi:hypothetical protein
MFYCVDWKTVTAIQKEQSVMIFGVKQAILWDKNTA